MNKKIIFGLLLSLFVTNIVSAQPKDNKRKEAFDKFKAQRVAFITEKVNLTSEEAIAFWPLCNELQEKKFELNKPLRELRRDQRNEKKKLTAEDYLKIIDLNAEIKLKEAQLEKEYLEKFKKVLSSEKIFKYQQAEEDFMKQVFTPERRKQGDKRPDRKKNS